jgi:hypothetical protein
MHHRRVVRLLLWSLLVLVTLSVVGGGALWLSVRDAIGGAMKDERLTRVERSPQWRNGGFHNRLPTSTGSSIAGVRAFLFGGSKHRTPDLAVPVERRAAADYRTPPASGLRATWLGHSTLLLEIDGRRVLIDPVWGERASPLPGGRRCPGRQRSRHRCGQAARG